MLSCVLSGGSSTLVMDAELVAVDRANGNRLRAFQELSTRARGQITSHEVFNCVATPALAIPAILQFMIQFALSTELSCQLRQLRPDEQPLQ